MNFNQHSDLKGQHAFLGASKYHWLNYDDDKLIFTYQKAEALKRGIELHEFAATCIRLNQNLPRTRKTLNMYVNDCIGYKMTPEQVLYYSENCFGTTDAISFRKDVLRISDLKTGETPAKIEQLEIYAALFCLEYGIKPVDILIDLKIYQNNEVLVHQPEVDEIVPIMDTIIHFDKIINQIKGKE